MNENKKRTNVAEIVRRIDQPDLPGIPAQGWGIGEPPSPSPAVWGEYLNVCTDFEFSAPASPKKIRDPRLTDLEAMGVRKKLIEIAEAIGVDNFLKMWKIVETDYEAHKDGDSVLRLRMPRYRLYNRYQRNRYAESLFALGHSASEVARRIERYMCEKLHKDHVFRLKKKM